MNSLMVNGATAKDRRVMAVQMIVVALFGLVALVIAIWGAR
jgi:hypothetical protein